MKVVCVFDYEKRVGFGNILLCFSILPSYIHLPRGDALLQMPREGITV